MENSLGIKSLYKPRSIGSRKGDNGRLIVVGGSTRYYGAPALVSLAALKAGTDLVYTIVPSAIAPTVASYSPDLIVWSYSGEILNRGAIPLIKELNEKTDALVLGNGLTSSPYAIKAAQDLIQHWGKPVILDADAIGRITPSEPSKAIYTPHDGEFLRLTGKKLPSGKTEKEVLERSKLAQKEAAKLGVILLKGRVDIITDGEEVYFNRTGNSAMACGGTGDVLAGLVGAFASQGYPLTNSARLGAYLNGLAGDLAFKELGYSLRATDVIKFIPPALRSLSKK